MTLSPSPSPVPDVALQGSTDYLPLWIALIGIAGTLLAGVLVPLTQRRMNAEDARRSAIREEYSAAMSSALTSLTLQFAPEPEGSEAVADHQVTVQTARLEMILAIDRFGMLLTKRERPVLDLMKRLLHAESSLQGAAALEGVAHCIPSWHRGELKIGRITAEYARVVKNVSRSMHPSNARNS